MSATVVSVALLFEIVGAALLVWVFFGETPPPTVWPGAMLIAVGIVQVVRFSPPGTTGGRRLDGSAPPPPS